MRLRPLDGLRGFAALAVVICHSFLSSPVFFAALYVPTDLHRFSLNWWLTRPPINLLWSGQQPVIIFFVLSGLVVVLPFVREAPANASDWLAYYPRRLVRLYLPTWAAVGVAVILAQAFHRHGVAGFSRWLTFHDNPNWNGVTKDLTLLRGTDILNGPLWTLQWEMWFSLLLPIFVVLARVGRRASLVKVLVMLDLIVVGVHTHHAWLIYLPVFGIGSAMAGDLDRIGKVADRLRGRWILALLLLAVAIAMLDVNSIRLLRGPVSLADPVNPVVTAAGGGLVVFLVLTTSGLRSACSGRVAQWLGKRSFSLYLIHEPIVVSVALLLGRGTSIFTVAAIAIPASVAASWVFQLVVEGPAHDLSRRIGRAISTGVVARDARAQQFT